jgi:hypothetical protein
VDLSAAQDVEAGDGTTSVVVLAGSFLGAAERMLEKGMHPTIIAEAFLKASAKAVEYLTELSTPVDLNDKPSLLRAASTSLNSKVSPVSFLPYLYKLSLADCLTVLVNFGTHCSRSCDAARDAHVVERRSPRHPPRQEGWRYH